MSRRLGLSIKSSYVPLLSTVGGKERAKLEQYVDDDALPLSSGDEEDEVSNPTPKKPTRPKGLINKPISESSDESEPEKRTRGDIKPTAFGSSNPKLREAGQGISKRPNDDEVDDSATEKPNKRRKAANKRKRGDADDSIPEPTRKAPSQKTPTSSAHLKDPYGFAINRKSTMKFGSQKAANSQSSQTFSKKTTIKKPAKLKAPDPLSSPEKPQKGRLVAPRSSIPSSPEQKPVRPFIRGSQGDGFKSASPEPRTTLKQPPIWSQGSRNSEGRYQSPHQPPWQKGLDGKKIDMKKLKAEKARPRSPLVAAKFMMPADLSDGEENKWRGGDDDAYSIPSDLENLSDSALESEPEDPTTTDDPGGMTTCPWCGDPVEASLWRDFSKGRTLNINMQKRFCQKHKKDAAKDIWRSRHYPTIQWDKIEDRFDEHRQFLLGIIGGESSHFRRLFAESVDSGTAARTLQKEDNLNPGYYGTRGFNLMCDYLSLDAEFSDLIRDKAVTDRAISGRGKPAFVQRVLVAELAVRLIQEDMDVSNREAREIMEESKAVGELIHGQH